ncbi:hypothetical protein, partial [Pseudomonas sp. GM67]|uniref:hypothetical protein n=1 Tax=Pseudomonas sp. GM67 TaxID=1144335 RepID=UPI001EE672B9
WLLWGFSKVTRRKGETISHRYRRNGYAHTQLMDSERLYCVSEYALHKIFTKPPRQFARASRADQ